MNISLSSFEQVIDEAILNRGLNCFSKGGVKEFAETSAGEYIARVSDTDVYTVHLKINSDIIVDHHCSCPNGSPICSHLVAVIFFIQQDDLNFETKKVKKKKAKRVKSEGMQVKEVLKKISPLDLLQFIEEESSSDKKFRMRLLARFDDLLEDHSKAFYEKRLKAVIRLAIKKNGWRTDVDSPFVELMLRPIFNRAVQAMEDETFEVAFDILVALLEALSVGHGKLPADYGEIGFHIDKALDMLFELSESPLSPQMRKQVFDYCIKAYDYETYQEWNGHAAMMKIASSLACDTDEAEKVFECLDQHKKSGGKEESEILRLELIRRFYDDTVVEEYIKSHLSNPGIRDIEIERAFDNGDYDRAKLLAKKGIKQDESKFNRSTRPWYHWLLKIAIVQEDQENIIGYARHLVMNDYHGSKEYYQILKSIFPGNQWDDFIASMIDELKTMTYWQHQEVLKQIYIVEEYWDELFLHIKKQPSLNALEQYEELLLPHYRKEIMDLYVTLIIDFMINNTGRNYYRAMCKIIKRMRKNGGEEEGEKVIAKLRATYPYRRALIEELDKLEI
ncbi:SWIM zinc finger family protein [Membranihabitans marinus]|uniref:SWIM zinc finger family protein n=1 Tax=Membranihabitans marinus TaxID=1227546 RepID=UPI001F1BAE6B|nr:SWIM zinc finger family protein [Membranihabitans marinus]